jgi:hypothetical protein
MLVDSKHVGTAMFKYDAESASAASVFEKKLKVGRCSDPMKPELKAPGTQRLKPKCDEPPSKSAFKFNLRRYIKGKALMAKLHRDETAALYKSYPKVGLISCDTKTMCPQPTRHLFDLISTAAPCHINNSRNEVKMWMMRALYAKKLPVVFTIEVACIISTAVARGLRGVPRGGAHEGDQVRIRRGGVPAAAAAGPWQDLQQLRHDGRGHGGRG